jgi:alpha-beta hydrolase superfamily lysophospholipase
MKEENGFYKDGRFYRSWMPEGEIKELIVVSHGLGEHSGRYNFLVNYFVPKGYAIFALDHLGHGKSSGVRGHVNTFAEYDIDLADFITFALAKVQMDQAVLIGHSLGAVIAHHYLMSTDARIKRVVLSSPAYRKKVQPSAFIATMGKLLSKIAPKLTLDNEINVNDISRNEDVVAAYVNDELVHGRVSARFFTSFLAAEKKLKGSRKLSCPILYLVAMADRIVEPNGAREAFDRLESEKKWIGYDGFYHEIFNENERERVFADLENWLSTPI